MLHRSIALSLALLCAGAQAQVLLHTDLVASAGVTSKAVVKDSNGILYCVSIQESAGTNAVVLQYSADGGVTWFFDPFVFNDATSGLSGASTVLTNQCAVAIDDQNTLHVVWAAYYYGSNYRQYYRNFNFYTQTPSAIVDINAVTGAAVTSRTAANDIVVDANNDVWIAAHGPSSWVEVLLKSASPYAAGGAFTNLGAISPSASSQTSRLAVDSLGTIHCTFYRNVGNGNYEHRAYVPGTGWSATTVIGNTTPPNDYFGAVATDLLGNLHCAYVKDAGNTTTWQFGYRVRDINGVWSAETPIFSATTAQYSGIANYIIFALACDETSGVATVVYRDLSTNGALRVAHKTPSDTAFKAIPNDLTPPSTLLHEYYTPTIRGTLYPASNRTAGSLDMTWQWRPTSTAPFFFMYDKLDVAVIDAPLPLVVGTTTVMAAYGPSQPLFPYACAFAGTDLPPILLPDGRTIPIALDLLVTFSLDPLNGIFVGTSGLLDPTGIAAVSVNTPAIPALIGYPLYACMVTADPAYPSGIRSISAARTLVIQ
jgi:hypothetical protein